MRACYGIVLGVALVLPLVLAGNAWCEPAQAGPVLRLFPAEIQFASTEGAATVSVMLGETALKAKDIKSAAMVDKAWMFKVTKSEKDPATVTVSTLSDKVEDGSYRLAVKAGGQIAYADVYVTLTPTVSTSVRTFLPPRLELDSNYQQGTSLTYKIEGPIDLDYTWTVNGKAVLQGPGETKLVVNLDEAGPCTIAVTAKQGEKVVGHSEGATTITAAPPAAPKR